MYTRDYPEKSAGHDRLDHLLRGWGIATKDEVHHLAAAGRITVNGTPCLEGGIHCPPDAVIALDHVPLKPQRYLTVMMNKPAGYVCMDGDLRYPDVCSLLRQEGPEHTLFSIGRLDADTEGLLLLSNSGELSTRIAHPVHTVTKTYLADLDRPLCDEAETILLAGAMAPDGNHYRPALLTRISQLRVQVTVTEGKYHEVKRLIRICGPYVRKLRRVAIGCLPLDPTLAPGAYRELTENEVTALFCCPPEASLLLNIPPRSL